MALRLVELTVPGEDLSRIGSLLEGIEIVGTWSAGTPAGGCVRILLEAQHTEALFDALLHGYGAREGFRLVSLPVEATLPPIEAPAPVPEGAVPRKIAGRISREELSEDLADAARLTPVYLVTVVLSTLVAAVGLMRGDVAIVIGAMVIAPLLGPNIALSLAATLGDVGLARRSLRSIAAGVTTAAVLSLALGMLLEVDPFAPELLARTRADLPDVVLALAAGAAGSLAFTTGVPAVVVGVMVAVALLPPLVTAGLLAGAGHLRLAEGALMLLATNVVCVNLAAVATFLAQKVRPRNWWEVERAQRATWIAVATWIALLAALLGLILFGRVGSV